MSTLLEQDIAERHERNQRCILAAKKIGEAADAVYQAAINEDDIIIRTNLYSARRLLEWCRGEVWE